MQQPKNSAALSWPDNGDQCGRRSKACAGCYQMVVTQVAALWGRQESNPLLGELQSTRYRKVSRFCTEQFVQSMGEMAQDPSTVYGLVDKLVKKEMNVWSQQSEIDALVRGSHRAWVEGFPPQSRYKYPFGDAQIARLGWDRRPPISGEVPVFDRRDA